MGYDNLQIQSSGAWPAWQVAMIINIVDFNNILPKDEDYYQLLGDGKPSSETSKTLP